MFCFKQRLGTKDQAELFVSWLNTLWLGLTLSYEWSDKSIKFLITQDIIETNMYVQPTKPQLYLHYISAHTPHVFKAIIFGQALNIKMICSKEEFVERHVDNLKQKFRERGYPEDLVTSELSRAL